jgi:N-acetylglucosamine-6-phosphate deacetylase
VSRTEILGRNLSTGASILVKLEEKTIFSIEPSNEAPDLWISAGLVDLQVNGYLGLDLNGPNLTSETISQLVRSLLATGVTTFAPTVITAAEESIIQRLTCIANTCTHDPVVAACIPYIHVEGPHISPLDGYRGAHPAEWVRPPSLAEFDRWQAACNGLVGMVTLSPHFPESNEYIAGLVARGIHVSLGHTNASHAQIHDAVRSGARLSTHLGNGIAPQIDRHPNPIWSQLAEDSLTASFIADGHHLPAETLSALVRAKGLNRSILISDAVALAGMPPGHYVASVGGRVELTADGRLSMEGISTLAGAAIPLMDCVSRAARMMGRPLAEAIVMATENPGRFAANRGRLQPGERADIIRFHWNEQDNAAIIADVWLAGEHLPGTCR